MRTRSPYPVVPRRTAPQPSPCRRSVRRRQQSQKQLVPKQAARVRQAKSVASDTVDSKDPSAILERINRDIIMVHPRFLWVSDKENHGHSRATGSSSLVIVRDLEET